MNVVCPDVLGFLPTVAIQDHDILWVCSQKLTRGLSPTDWEDLPCESTVNSSAFSGLSPHRAKALAHKAPFKRICTHTTRGSSEIYHKAALT